MIIVKGVQIDFDMTSPGDVARYQQAKAKAEAESGTIVLQNIAPDDPAFLEAYVEMLNTELLIFGNFIDNAFGDGIASQLLGSNPSLTKVFEIDEELGQALEAQGKEFGVKLGRFQPNRATRRANGV